MWTAQPRGRNALCLVQQEKVEAWRIMKSKVTFRFDDDRAIEYVSDALVWLYGETTMELPSVYPYDRAMNN